MRENDYPCKPLFYYIKWGVSRYTLHECIFMMFVACLHLPTTFTKLATKSTTEIARNPIDYKCVQIKADANFANAICFS